MKSLLPCACVAGLMLSLIGCGSTPAPTPRDATRPPAQPEIGDGTPKTPPKKTYPEVDTPSIKFKDDGSAVDVVDVPLRELEALRDTQMTGEKWSALFAVYVDRGEGVERKDQTPLLGTYRIEKESLRFEPRFPLARGVRYRAVFDVTCLPGRDASKVKPIETTLLIPKPKTTPTVVEQVYPTRDDLPENHLKFYLHFSAPMSRGEAYSHVKLLDENGKAIESPFLELPQELWDPQQQRFTLRIDPGRIKQGLRPREDLGPVLEKGKKYTLVIDREWSDGNGEPLKETFKKTFHTIGADESQPDPKKWKLETPAVGTDKPLSVGLGKSLDRGMLDHAVWVEDAQGRRLEGRVEIADKETVWRFTPKTAWKAGTYHLVADTLLEDLAGNNIARPFEVDVLRPIPKEVKTETVKVPFEVK